MNSVFTLREASCSPSLRAAMSASISSKNMTEGCSLAVVKRARISFSPSPRYLLVTEEADMEKNTKSDSEATAFASNVLPVPGGPKSNTPLGGDLSPVNRSGRRFGRMTASCSVCLAKASPAISPQRMLGFLSSISSRIWVSYSLLGGAGVGGVALPFRIPTMPVPAPTAPAPARLVAVRVPALPVTVPV
eukprot:CAMPEP_0173311818 /NCGR_PEP_ID=MMETSP1143-20121109/23755_1 /TAXON_ID=483371 /ORGANISM="non described non described, Strain CCMP2298" /LENGTH=189 /DNA_ID=CAMNT_0014253879 /DNA_START=183 /DNA_END=749 /DNA_ORIENTATION=+